MGIEEVKMFRKFKKEEESDSDQKNKEMTDEEILKKIYAKIEERRVISREEFRIYEDHEKYETYTKDWYPFSCPKCGDSYDVIIRGNTANEKIVQIIYVEDGNIEKD
ncbi:MAG: hypothetical protein JW776_01055 [Candidatus Lokiarchaeota archaeon]|nr:hypothetical protein [Candidatus Lokiarchaeota archaeon]